MAKTTKSKKPVVNTEKKEKAPVVQENVVQNTASQEDVLQQEVLQEAEVNTILPANEVKNTEKAKKSKSIDFEEAYVLLKSGKTIKVKGQKGFLKLEEGTLKQFADNGDYLGNKTIADLQEETEFEEK